jgi:formylglycine-generating enzyme required for sulfatase activity
MVAALRYHCLSAWRRLCSAHSGTSYLARETFISGGRIMRNEILVLTVLLFSASHCLADCPSADLTGDCFIDFEDFAVLANQWSIEHDWEDIALIANQWLTTDPCVPDDMLYIPDGEFDMGDHHNDGESDELPVHAVFLDYFFMSKYKITNQQYCDYLNDANSLGQIKVFSGIVYASSDSNNIYPYCDTHSYSAYSQIDYSGGVFNVMTKGERDMSDDPMVQVTWYGAAAYCNRRSEQEGYEPLYDPCDPNWHCDFARKGYRLPTEAEWEYIARGGECSPYYRFPWGNTISHSQANYYSSSSYSYDISPTRGYHPIWNDGIYPYTSPVGSFSANGFGLFDTAGNVWEWCNDWHSSTYYSSSPLNNPTGPTSGSFRVLRGGSWASIAYSCRAAYRNSFNPDGRGRTLGFRVVLDLH